MRNLKVLEAYMSLGLGELVSNYIQHWEIGPIEWMFFVLLVNIYHIPYGCVSLYIS